MILGRGGHRFFSSFLVLSEQETVHATVSRRGLFRMLLKDIVGKPTQMMIRHILLASSHGHIPPESLPRLQHGRNGVIVIRG